MRKGICVSLQQSAEVGCGCDTAVTLGGGDVEEGIPQRITIPH